MLTPAEQNDANMARIMVLSNDADAKAVEFAQLHKDAEARYYQGLRDGLRRALNVLNGKG